MPCFSVISSCFNQSLHKWKKFGELVALPINWGNGLNLPTDIVHKTFKKYYQHQIIDLCMAWNGWDLFFLMPNKIILRRLVRITTNVRIAISAWVYVYVGDGVNSHFLHYSYWFIITNCAKFLDNKIKIEIWKTYVKLKQKLFRWRWNAKVNVQLCKHVTSCVFAYKIHFIYLSPAFQHAIVFTRFSNENTQWKQ